MDGGVGIGLSDKAGDGEREDATDFLRGGVGGMALDVAGV